PVVEPAPGETPLWPVVEIDALFALDTDLSALRQRLRELETSEIPLAVRFVEDADWSQTWRNHKNAYCFGGRLWVVPRDAAAPLGGVVLRLDPGLAFGTGGHATTALCLEWLWGGSGGGWAGG